MKPNDVLTLATIVWAIVGGVVCFHYATRCERPDKYFRIYAGIILVYFAAIYSLAFLLIIFGEWFGEYPGLTYSIRSGMLTKTGVVALIGLLIAWAIHDMHKC